MEIIFKLTSSYSVRNQITFFVLNLIFAELFIHGSVVNQVLECCLPRPALGMQAGIDNKSVENVFF
jgi:hypothetical protein